MAVTANDRAKDAPATALMARVLGLVGPDGETHGVIVNRCRKFRKADVEAALVGMVDRCQLTVTVAKSGNNAVIKKYARP